MDHKLFIYNTLTRKKEKFIPATENKVGLYVCGPTVYGEPHLGHIRMAISFDILFRYLLNLGYAVRYVRNITDVGHLEDEVSGEGADRIQKRARLEEIEPMEVVQKYKNLFNESFQKLNILPPSIEPQASGHIIEQQQMIRKILEKGYAYEVEGSVYFDIDAYNKEHNYGKLSGRKVEDMLTNTRTLDGQSEKRNPLDFALWKKASPEHLMRWPSEWSDGFPGWHLECSAMGTKYLGETFDIHGGGMDLMFPHHECEIAQSVAANGKEHVRYWMHNNMITIDGQKMAKSLNNFITLREMFSGNHPKLEKAYSPNAIRFFVLQAHYRSTLDFSNEALQAAEKGLKRLFSALEALKTFKPSEKSSFDIESYLVKVFEALNDDLNTPIAIAQVFNLVPYINKVKEGSESISRDDLEILKSNLNTIIFDILGLLPEEDNTNAELEKDLLELIIDLRLKARANKDYATSDIIRDKLKEVGIALKDTKDGTSWEKE
ncbi:MAG: cysteine--tRNA ligase [Bacteroidales bacterium]|nr:cysteine--tRNA ligase [Bacteroidales bacterium]MBN2820609.1 cysteine--tRNA ligase [Bacteroidales bacterium]